MEQKMHIDLKGTFYFFIPLPIPIKINNVEQTLKYAWKHLNVQDLDVKTSDDYILLHSSGALEGPRSSSNEIFFYQVEFNYTCLPVDDSE